MPRGIPLTEEQKESLFSKIIEMYSKGLYTISACCKKCGIGKRTFDKIVSEKASNAEDYKKAKDDHYKAKSDRVKLEIVHTARDRLLNIISGKGKQYEETRIIYQKTGDEWTEKERHVSTKRERPTATHFAIALNLYDSEAIKKEPENKNEVRFLEGGKNLPDDE